jgi:hypothetical protein
MATKKAHSKRSRQAAVKRSSSGRKTVRGSDVKKSSGRSATFQKAAPGSVFVESTSTFSPYARRALSVFSAGVQRALKQLAQHNIPAVVIEDGHRIVAVPTKVGGRYVVTGSQVRETGGRSAKTQKRRSRAV